MKTILIFIILIFIFHDLMMNVKWVSILLTIAFFIDILILNKPKKKNEKI